MTDSKRKPQKKRDLTLKQKIFAKAYIETKNMTKAGMIAGYAHPMQAGHATLRKIEKREEFLKMMDDAGLSDNILLRGIKEGITATKKTYAIAEGAICDEREDPDYHARHKFIDTALKLRGRLSNDSDDNQAPPSGPIVILLGNDNQAAVLRSA